ncbi:MAG: SDR family oxidoreductase [Paenibacillus macerans]|uniref:SDR family NAD(P)-dependent oxidoreductase n=1 Tax=Paenibacillus TaxID=44249 RepID=UPI000EC1AF16|nr:SDR family oxidoreductase [Paenibacillus macerans]MBS5910610.1 SDR family oxidoreductase [Paenibacillus macerans]MDU7475398.1 SDR family oxidoreductase [Paenibacillus macerans]MEC0137302.1 SDR family oxidoreductase [Paenibacillus macerans]GBK60372.1 short-chain dehydrogenase [Paenibacillus macerans]GBK66670.1 short-chain dehydrogenase [Paenibacillus macerans]
MRFQQKAVIVTGGAGGIGAAAARLFAEEGAKVVIADLSEEGQMLADELTKSGLTASFIKTDVTQEGEVERMVEKTVERYGKLDILFANAGVGADGPTDQLSLEDWKLAVDINLTGVFLCNKYAIKQMLSQGNGGAIVNCGSVHSHVGKARVTAYAAAKGGVKMLTQSAAIAYAARNIRVNAVCPGYVDTPMINRLGEEVKNYLIGLHPAGRLGTAEEIAKAVLFLASDDASFITGTSLMVDGGYTAV